MLKLIARLYLSLNGWKLINEYPKHIKKSVTLGAPHTSNEDFLVARAAFFVMGVPVKFTIKKEAMFFPLNLILKPLGAIPIDRKKKNKGFSYVQQMIEVFDNYDKIFLMITPEGTRKKVDKLKSGFYHVAKGANVPVLLGFMDYKKKIVGIREVVIPSENMEKDMKKIIEFYSTITAKFPENGIGYGLNPVQK